MEMAPSAKEKKVVINSIVSKVLTYKQYQIPKPLYVFNTICIKYITKSIELKKLHVK